MEASYFGQFLKELRKQRKLTIRQLDLYSGVSHSYLSQLERGDRGTPSPDILKKLSAPLGVSYEELMIRAGYITEEQRSGQPYQALDHTNGAAREEALTDYMLPADSSDSRLIVNGNVMDCSEDEARHLKQQLLMLRAFRAMEEQYEGK